MADKDYIAKWLDESEENRRLFQQEELILDVTESICDVMDKANVSRKELADMMGTSKSNITQLLNGSRNMTLRKLADIAYFLNTCVQVRFCMSIDYGGWQTATAVIPRGSVTRYFRQPVTRATNDWAALDDAA